MDKVISTSSLYRVFQTAILGISGVLSVLFIGNFLIHFVFYLIDGTLSKFLSPMWIGINGMMVMLGLVFWFMVKRE